MNENNELRRSSLTNELFTLERNERINGKKYCTRLTYLKQFTLNVTRLNHAQY